jgi:SAM-dependent methyltransferase
MRVNVKEAREAYDRGENITHLLRQQMGETANTADIIEVAYDLQAGSYSRKAVENAGYLKKYCESVGKIIAPYVDEIESIIDIGTGECTSLAYLLDELPSSINQVLACDISWSRLNYGREFLRKHGSRPVDLFTADLMHLPLQTSSVDMVWSSHALEPNGGNERNAIREVLRVTRRFACLFEPSYENNTEEGRQRMDSLGYIRALPEAIEAEGGRLLDCLRHPSPSNPLNPTYAYIVEVKKSDLHSSHNGQHLWACPSTGLPMERREQHFLSRDAGLAYPVLDGIPILRRGSQIVATAMI